MVSNTTTTEENKRELKTRTAKNSFHLEFYYQGGGEVPQVLQGFFTDEYAATLAKNMYLQSKEPKPKKEKPKYTGKPVKA